MVTAKVSQKQLHDEKALQGVSAKYLVGSNRGESHQQMLPWGHAAGT